MCVCENLNWILWKWFSVPLTFNDIVCRTSSFFLLVGVCPTHLYVPASWYTMSLSEKMPVGVDRPDPRPRKRELTGSKCDQQPNDPCGHCNVTVPPNCTSSWWFFLVVCCEAAPVNMSCSRGSDVTSTLSSVCISEFQIICLLKFKTIEIILSLTSNVEKISNTWILKVQVARGAFVPARMFATYLSEVQKSITVLCYLSEFDKNWWMVARSCWLCEALLTGGSPSSFCQIGVLGGFESTSHFRDTSMPSRKG